MIAPLPTTTTDISSISTTMSQNDLKLITKKELLENIWNILWMITMHLTVFIMY